MITRTFNLGMVGHAQDKFTPETEAIARFQMVEFINHFNPTSIVSGHCHLGGVDIYAEEIATSLGINLIIHKPVNLSWSGKGGYRDRNLKIARDSHLVLVVVVKDYPSTYSGLIFNGCYHCQGRNPKHIKSGACWTAWKCRKREWIII